MSAAAISLVTLSTAQIRFKIFPDGIATGVTIRILMTAVLRFGEQLEKLLHYYFPG
jgi:hypothetical protein